MKNTYKYILISLVAMFVVGCAHISATVPQTIEFKVEGKPISQLKSLAGETLRVSRDVETPSGRQISLVQAGMDSVAKWFVILGGILAVGGTIIGFLFKKWGISLSIVASGLITVLGTLVLQALITPILWASGLALAIGLAYELWLHRKNVPFSYIFSLTNKAIYAIKSTFSGILSRFKKKTPPSREV